MYFIISSLRRDYTRPDLPSGPNETHFSADIAGLLGEMLSILQSYLYLFLSFKEKTQSDSIMRQTNKRSFPILHHDELYSHL